MKNFKLLISLFIVFVMLFSCQKQKGENSQKVMISKDAAIELIFSSLIQGKEDQFYKDYFPKVLPIVSEYKGKVLFASKFLNSYNTEIKSQTVAFFEWPDIETFIKIGNDSRLPELIKIRNVSLSYINEANFYKSNETKEIYFYKNKIYSIISSNADLLIDEIKKNNGKIILKLELLKESIGSFKEDPLYIVEWNNAKSIDNFYNQLKTQRNEDKCIIISFTSN